MQYVLDLVSLSIAGAGIIVLGVSVTLVARWKDGVPLVLELWTAAGLVRLAGEPSWARIATAAAIVAVRKLVMSRPWLAST
jgi:hypothetical protein